MAMTKDGTDKLYMTEILNDIHRNGYQRGGKADEMLHDWAKELKDNARASFPASRIRKVHAEVCGANNW